MNFKHGIFALILLFLFYFFAHAHAQAPASPTDSVLVELENALSPDLRKSIKICDQLLSSMEQGDYCLKARILALKSRFQTGIAQYEEALSTVIEADKYANEECDPLTNARVSYSYSLVYYSLNNMAKSDSFAGLGLRSLRNQSDTTMLIRMYMAKGISIHALDRCVPYYDTALFLANKTGSIYFRQQCYNNYGYAYANNEDFEMAEIYFKKALLDARALKQHSQIATIYNNLAGLTPDKHLMLFYVDSALSYAKRERIPGDIELYSENKAYALYQLGRYKEGYDLLYRALELKDSILGIKQVEAVAEMEQKYESEKKSGLIQKLKLDKLNSDLFELKLKRRQVILISGSVILFLLAVFLGYSYMNSRRNRRTLELKNSIIDHEREVSDNLLLNILPAEVAQELKEKGTSEARLYDPVTVLFTDFVSFTSISENMSPKNLVAEVNRLFTGYDEIMEKHGLEKIKTIGDAYLAVCGLPFAHDDHAVRVVKAAKEIIAFTLENQSKFMVRVGINSGPVVAGIVGIKKYAYDIWGDTVNTASRMEESSEAGRINISGTTHELVKDHFPCEYRGKVEAKNKGEVDMYFVG